MCTTIAQGPKLRPKGPLPKALLPTKFGPPTPGWRRLAATLLLKMTKNGPLEAEATSDKQHAGGPKLDILGMSIAKGPKLGPKGPLPKALLPTKFGPSTPRWCRSAATLLLKMAQNGSVEAKMGPKGANSNKQQAGGLHSISPVRQSPKDPNLV